MRGLLNLIPFGIWLGLAVSWNVKEEAPALVVFEKGQTFEIACIDTIRVSLDGNCSFLLDPKNITADLAGVSPSDLRIWVDDQNAETPARVDGPGTFRYLLVCRDNCGSFEKCSGTVIAEDNTPPEIEGPADTSLEAACELLDSLLDHPECLEWTGTARWRDNCYSDWLPLESFTDRVDRSDCDTIRIFRTFFAEDSYGNRSQFEQIIKLLTPEAEDFTIQKEFAIGPCSDADNILTDAFGNIHPSISGWPYWVNERGDSLLLDPDSCGYVASYTDQRQDHCPGAYQLVRTWTIMDWCRDEQAELVQHIRVGDILAPELLIPEDTIKAATTASDCEGSWRLDPPPVAEDCNGFWGLVEIYLLEYSFYDAGASPDSTLWRTLELTDEPLLIENIPPGCHPVKFHLWDACGNRSSVWKTLCTSDIVAPVALCNDHLNLSLDNQGSARLDAWDVDEGSSDNCKLRHVEIQRTYSLDQACSPIPDSLSGWKPFVFFDCCDIEAELQVQLRAMDANGNQNTCWVTVSIEDKTAPDCIPPADTLISCLGFPTEITAADTSLLQNLFGRASTSDNCGATIFELPPISRLDLCGVGWVERRFVAIDYYGNRSDTCSQLVEVLPYHNYRIKFPRDYDNYCVQPTADSVEFWSTGCDMVGMFVEDEFFEGTGEECYKVFRQYRVVNWCEYEDGDDPVVVPRDADCDGDGGEEEVWVIVRPDSTTYLDADGDETNAFPAANTRGDACKAEGNPEGYWTDSDLTPGLRSTGYWEYTQVIKVFDDQPPVIIAEEVPPVCIDFLDCTAEMFVPFVVEDECAFGELDIRTVFVPDSIVLDSSYYSEEVWQTFGRYPKYILGGYIPTGYHEVEIIVSDRCGNVASLKVPIVVEDCLPPTPPICFNGLAAELMPLGEDQDVDGDGDLESGALTIWAKDFVKDLDRIYDCSLPLRFSINRVGEQPDVGQESLTLTCDDLGVLDVEIHVWDSGYNPNLLQPDGSFGGPNHEFCTTYILVQDNFGFACNPIVSGSIAGAVYTPEGVPVPGMTMEVAGAARQQVRSDINGSFNFEALPAGLDYSVSGFGQGDPRSGVTTFDLIKISKHILGIERFSNPYQLLAADVNASGSVTTLDLIKLRKLILHLESDLAVNNWQLFKDGYRWILPEAPWEEPSARVHNINDLPEGGWYGDFIAIKSGDVNGSATNGPDGRSLRQTRLEMERGLLLPDINLEEGGLYELPLTLVQAAQTEGLQFGLHWNREELEVIAVEPGLTRPEEWQWDPKGSLLVSWFRQNAVVNHDAQLARLKVRAKQASTVREAFYLGHRRMAPELYLFEQRPLALNLDFETQASGLSREAQINIWPNPTSGPIDLQVFWPHRERLQITLLDAIGRKLKEQTLEVHSIGSMQFTAEDFPEAGVYTILVEGEEARLYKRFIRL